MGVRANPNPNPNLNLNPNPNPKQVPVVRQAPSGASLTAIVHAPSPGAEYTIVAWTKPTATVSALRVQPLPTTSALGMAP